MRKCEINISKEWILSKYIQDLKITLKMIIDGGILMKFLVMLMAGWFEGINVGVYGSLHPTH